MPVLVAKKERDGNLVKIGWLKQYLKTRVEDELMEHRCVTHAHTHTHILMQRTGNGDDSQKQATGGTKGSITDTLRCKL